MKMEKIIFYFDVFLFIAAICVMISASAGYVLTNSLAESSKREFKNTIEICGYAIVALILLIWPLCFDYAPFIRKIIGAILIGASIIPFLFGGNAILSGGLGVGLIIALPAFYIAAHAAYVLLK